MSPMRLALPWMGWIGLVLVTPALAQDSENPVPYRHKPVQQNKSLVDRLDDFGRGVFGGVLAPKEQEVSPRPVNPYSGRTPASPTTTTPRAATRRPAPQPTPAIPSLILNEAEPSAVESRSPVLPSLDELDEERPSASGASPAPAATPRPSMSVASRPDVPASPTTQPIVPTPQFEASPSPARVGAHGATGNLPLYERLKTLRESAFGQSSPVDSPRSVPSGPGTGPDAADPPSSAASPRTRVVVPTQTQPAPGGVRPESPHVGLQNPMSMQPRSPEGAAVQREVSEHFAAQRAAREAAREAARKAALDRDTGLPSRSEPTPAPPADRAPPSSAAEGALKPPASSDTGSTGSDAVLFSRQSPILSVETHGPRRITVGKESAYEVVMRNAGQVAANDLIVTVDLPAWADVLGAEASAGGTQSVDAAGRNGQFQWKVGRLEAKALEKLVLRIVPRESKPFELGVRWSFTPVRSQAEIEVQEPKIEISLDGPREVVHGQKEVYKLAMANTGNGPAENLVVALISTGQGENVSASHKLGTLAPGEKKVIEVELTARQGGQLAIEVTIKGDGGVKAALTEKITVRKPELTIKVDGPKVQYVGTSASYQIRAANPGTSPARNVRVQASLPEGMEQVVPSQDGRTTFDRRKIQWTFAEIAGGASQEMTVKCNLATPGEGRIAVEASADDNLAASDAISTQVEATADLSLSVVDPARPVAVGDEALYEIRILNRGTKGAQNVEVVAYFSTGIEPVTAEGATSRIGPGQVVFSPVALIPAGQTHVLKVKAKAETAGTHIFRTEVYCRPLGARLVCEETTRFYGESTASTKMLARPETPAPAGDSSGVRTAERFRVQLSNEPTPAPRKN